MGMPESAPCGQKTPADRPGRGRIAGLSHSSSLPGPASVGIEQLDVGLGIVFPPPGLRASKGIFILRRDLHWSGHVLPGRDGREEPAPGIPADGVLPTPVAQDTTRCLGEQTKRGIATYAWAVAAPTFAGSALEKIIWHTHGVISRAWGERGRIACSLAITVSLVAHATPAGASSVDPWIAFEAVDNPSGELSRLGRGLPRVWRARLPQADLYAFGATYDDPGADCRGYRLVWRTEGRWVELAGAGGLPCPGMTAFEPWVLAGVSPPILAWDSGYGEHEGGSSHTHFYRLEPDRLADIGDYTLSEQHSTGDLPWWTTRRNMKLTLSRGGYTITATFTKTLDSINLAHDQLEERFSVKTRETWRLTPHRLELVTSKPARAYFVSRKQARMLFELMIDWYYVQKGKAKRSEFVLTHWPRYFQIEFAFLARLRPDFAPAHYNAACMHALLDERPQAMSYLRTAIRLDPAYARKARRDPDLQNVRELLVAPPRKRPARKDRQPSTP